MKFASFALLSLALSGLIFTASCIRDEIPECPPLNVKITVKDKNYFNVNKVDLEESISEDLSFREYIPTIYWTLRELETGKIIEESDFITLSGNEKEFKPEICPCIPHGKYVLTVWGGMKDDSQLSDELDRVTFHPANTQGDDIYMTNDTIVYDAWHNDFSFEMERTKGKLIIEKIGVPQSITHSEKKITGIYGALKHHNFQYEGQTSVNLLTPIDNHDRTVTKTLLAPSISKDGSALSINFTGKDNNGNTMSIDTRKVKMTMQRNVLTVLRYVWDPAKNDFQIYMLVNDTWESVNNMGVE